MRWAASIDNSPTLEVALARGEESLSEQLGDQRPDLILAFATRDHQTRWHEIPEALRQRFPDAAVVGCSAGGVLANGTELEDGPGLALCAARLPGVERTPFHIDAEALEALVGESGESGESGHDDLRARWLEAIGIAEGPDPLLMLFPDPFSWPGPEVLGSLDRAFPQGTVVGGLASGGARPGEHRLFCDRSTHHRGMVGLALRGNLEVETIVAQGCRPVGAPMFVTRRQANIVYELDGRPAVEALQQLFTTLEPDDRARARTSLLIGLSMHPQLEVHDQGDFLVRNLIGVDPSSGAVGIAAELHGHPVVQFHLRDAQTAASELHDLAAEHQRIHGERAPAVALLFSCLGRGEHLYGRTGHDSEVLREHLGATLPLAGFFCNGEIGPIAGRTFMHGYTSSILLLRPATMV